MARIHRAGPSCQVAGGGLAPLGVYAHPLLAPRTRLPGKRAERGAKTREAAAAAAALASAPSEAARPSSAAAYCHDTGSGCSSLARPGPARPPACSPGNAESLARKVLQLGKFHLLDFCWSFNYSTKAQGKPLPILPLTATIFFKSKKLDTHLLICLFV